MAMNVLLGILVAGIPLVSIELASRLLGLQPEIARKLVHVGSAVAVCMLVSFCNLTEIALIAAIFFVVLTVLRPGRYWHALYRVKRQSLGEITFPLGIGMATVISHNVPDFLLAVLTLGFADTAAEIVGSRIKSVPLPWATSKTYAGTAAFWLVAFSIAAIFAVLGYVAWPEAITVPLLAAAGESVAAFGADNIVIPIVVTIALRWL